MIVDRPGRNSIVTIPAIEPYLMPEESELPENTARWTINPARAVLLIHDMQCYFLQPFPVDKAPTVDLIRNVTELRERCAELDIPVVYTAQPGSMTDEQRGLLKDFWGPGMTASMAHRGIPNQFAPTENDLVLTKWRASAFFRTALLESMRGNGRDQLIVCGVYAHVGILMTANDALANDIQTFVVADAVADFSSTYHRMALDYTATRCGMAMSTAKVLDALLAKDTS
jgi:trans-2,3-dihydro-3-hydroxyanthranilic acid synthase